MTGADGREQLDAALRDSSGALLSYFVRRLEREDAADALAEVMTTAWTRVDALPSGQVEARMWLFGIARNTLLHAQRGNVRRSKLAKRLRVSFAPRTAPGADEGLDVRDALGQIDSDLAELVRLVHWDGFSLVEAAGLLEIPASTARGRYQRARKQLGDLLALELREV